MDNHQIKHIASAIYKRRWPRAKEHFSELNLKTQEIYIASAKAAIEAMREPTEIQYEALSATNKIWSELNSYEVWTTYIDALVK